MIPKEQKGEFIVTFLGQELQVQDEVQPQLLPNLASVLAGRVHKFFQAVCCFDKVLMLVFHFTVLW